jgi:uncharacterized protein (DUF924 family)
MSVDAGSDAVLRFWFEEIDPAKWFAQNPEFDAEIARRFSATHEAVGRGDCAGWRATPTGRLAEVIVLDQFSRNLFRGTPRAFAFDPLALALAQEAVARGADRALAPAQRAFLYMPYMHSESLPVHEQALQLFSQPGLESNLKYERRHRAIVERFGRYPHRNAILGRHSTPEELEFLKQPGSGF